MTIPTAVTSSSAIADASASGPTGSAIVVPSSTSPASTKGPDPFKTFPAAVPGEIRVVSVGVDIVPVSGIKTAVSQAQALAVVEKSEAADVLVRGTSANPTLMLANYHDLLRVGAVGDDGQFGPNEPGVSLSWVARWTGLPYTGPAMGGNPAATTTVAHPDWTCAIYVAIDANTAAPVGGFSFCGL